VKFLVDADVLSEATKPQPAGNVVGWLRQHDNELAVSPIILGELEYGILHLPAGRKRKRLMDWFTSGVQQLNVLDIDAATAHIWAKLLAELRRKGREMPIKDSLIAATARQYGLAIATRNTADYKNAGVQLVNPFEAP
jgi:predicted nucleic acid-binding protein